MTAFQQIPRQSCRIRWPEVEFTDVAGSKIRTEPKELTKELVDALLENQQWLVEAQKLS